MGDLASLKAFAIVILGGLGNITKRVTRDGFSLSANKCIQRTRREHEDLLSEFASILSGVEQTLQATGMIVRRLSDVEIFLELKRALNPLLRDPIPLRCPESSLRRRCLVAHSSSPLIRSHHNRKPVTSRYQRLRET